MSTLRLSGLKARTCSGLTLSRALSLCLQRRALTRPNGSNLRNRVSTAKTPLPIEAVSQHKETDLLEDGERRLGEKDLDLPARSRSGEGRARTFSRSDSDGPRV